MSLAKQKAEKLINDMYPQTDVPKYENAIKCAIIAVEEIIKALESFGYSGSMYDCFYTGRIETTEGKLPTDFWCEVLTELKSRQ